MLSKILERLEPLNEETGPILSLYQDTAKVGNDKELGPIQFKNLLKEAETQINEKFSKDNAKWLLDQLDGIQNNTDFWTYRGEGLALFARGQTLIEIILNEDVNNMVVVANNAHILPLIAANQHVQDHYILDLSKDSFRLFKGSITEVEEIKLEDVENRFDELFDDFDNEADVNTAGYRGRDGGYHGHRGSDEEKEKDQEKYYKYLDRNLTPLFEEDQQPVLVSGVTENTAQWFNEVDSNVYVREDLGKPFDDFNEKGLREELQKIFSRLDYERVSKTVDSLNSALASSRASTRSGDIRNALEQAKVRTLLVKDNWHEENARELDEFVIHTIQQGGDILIVPHEYEDMDTRLAALYRY